MRDGYFVRKRRPKERRKPRVFRAFCYAPPPGIGAHENTRPGVRESVLKKTRGGKWKKRGRESGGAICKARERRRHWGLAGPGGRAHDLTFPRRICIIKAYKGGVGMDGYGRKSERIAGEVRAAILAGRHRPGERIESGKRTGRALWGQPPDRAQGAFRPDCPGLSARRARARHFCRPSAAAPAAKPSPWSPPILPTTSSPASFRASTRNWPSMDTAFF